jgi:lysyl-tRNA synthetase class 1
MFLDKSGRKISKSAGNVFSPQVWLRYGSPQSLLLLMFKRFIGTRTISVMDIPQYMTELDELEDVYFGRKEITDKKELAKLKGLYEYCWLLKPPSEPSVHVPYNLLVYLAKVAPKESKVKFIIDKLKRYGYLKDFIPDNLMKRIEYALNWSEDFAEIKEITVKISEGERRAIKELIKFIPISRDENDLQNAVFNIAKKNSINPKEFFKTLYTILVGAPEGPRLGPYIIAMGRENVAEALKRALSAAN